MSRIWVCGLHEMLHHVERVRPERLISLLPPGELPATPAGMEARHHLRLPLDDVSHAGVSDHAPDRARIATLIRFLRASRGRSLMVHCMAGVSRSTAAALIALTLDAPGREVEAAQVLRAAAPYAWPNPLMVELADRALRRRGRLVAALDAIGDPVLGTFPAGYAELPRSLGPPGRGRRTVKADLDPRSTFEKERLP